MLNLLQGRSSADGESGFGVISAVPGQRLPCWLPPWSTGTTSLLEEVVMLGAGTIMLGAPNLVLVVLAVVQPLLHH